jgi:hypothetical protein
MVGMMSSITIESVVIPVNFDHHKDTKAQGFCVYFIIIFVFFVNFVV